METNDNSAVSANGEDVAKQEMSPNHFVGINQDLIKIKYTPQVADLEKLEEYFNYKPMGEEQEKRALFLDQIAKMLAQAVICNTKPDVDQGAALKHLRECMLYVRDSIARESIAKE